MCESKSINMKRIFFSLFLLLSANFLNAQLSNGNIANFKFNNNLSDNSNSAIVLTNNGTSFGQDVYNSPNASVEFNGQSYLSFNDNDIKTPLPITISMLIKFNSFAEPTVVFMSDNIYNSYSGYWINVIQGTGQIVLNLSGGSGNQSSANRRSFVMDNSLNTGQWYTIVCVIRAYNDMQIYIDCVNQAGQYSGTGSTTMVYSQAESSFAYIQGNTSLPNGTYLNASLDDFNIWNRELTQNEIQEICSRKANIDDVQVESLNVSIFPNPLTDLLVISNKTNTKLLSCQIFDLNGHLIYEQELSSASENEVTTSELAQGAYILKVNTKDESKTLRFIKQ